jgi:hypothetical protein
MEKTSTIEKSGGSYSYSLRCSVACVVSVKFTNSKGRHSADALFKDKQSAPSKDRRPVNTVCKCALNLNFIQPE